MKHTLLPLSWHLMAYLPALVDGEYYYTALILLAYALAQGSAWLTRKPHGNTSGARASSCWAYTAAC